MKILNTIQQKLKAPKGLRNDFAHFNYRSCEKILEAVKPLLGEATLIISDEIILIGDRHYVKATATLNDEKESVSVSAFARESLEKKGMDSSQVTGAASSYARKYALNGLFAIDDTKDADSDDANTATSAKKKADKDFDAFMGNPTKQLDKLTVAPRSTPTATTGHVYKPCEVCKKAVSEKVESMSLRIYKKVLCFPKCQADYAKTLIKEQKTQVQTEDPIPVDEISFNDEMPPDFLK